MRNVCRSGPNATGCGKIITDAELGSANASDNCPVTLIRSGVPSGNLFPVGTTTITYLATNAAGGSATATQLVTVRDDTPPQVSCPASITQAADPGRCSTTVTYAVPTATDNCALASVACSPPPGSTFPTGTTPVTCTATDSVGNSSACWFAVRVTNTQPPAAPTNLRATAVSRSQVNLQWDDNACNEDGYAVEYSINGKSYYQIDTVGPNVIGVSVTGLRANKTYYFRVRAFNAYGYSAYSNPAKLKTPR